ncbi:hypothetical protein FV113G1_P10710 (plasmid) [Fusobacterium varium]|nr:hypothetical protein FV113G1_P10710 [Fusobacterium varium]
MNFNCFILLKILTQGRFTTNELLKYLSINPYSLQRNIKSLNNFLETMKISPIQKVENYFYLEITKEENNKILKKLNIYFSPQREDYLFLKILIRGFINLEYEANYLNISRSTIVRDFANVRGVLENYNIKTSYKSNKGIFIESKIPKIHYKLCLVIIKIILERKYIPSRLFDFIPELNFNNIKGQYIKLYKISEHLNIKMGEFIFSSIYSLIILNKYFKNIHILALNKRLQKISTKEDFLILKKYLSQKLDIEENILNYITTIIFDIKYNCINFSFFIPYRNKFLYKLKKYFKIDIEISPKIKKAISAKLFVSSIRYSNKIMHISTFHPNENDKIIINIIEKILSELEITYYYGDILQLLQIIKTLLIENILSKKIKILFLIQEYLTLNIEEISKKVRKISSNIEFTVKPTLYFEYLGKNISNHDLIISDYLNMPNINRIKILNSLELETIIYDFCVKKSIDIL